MPRVLHFGDAEKLRELFRRFGSRQLAEDHASLEFAINIKRGAVELTLAEMQLRKLRTPRRSTLNTDRRIETLGRPRKCLPCNRAALSRNN